jgi:hypothetical protein
VLGRDKPREHLYAACGNREVVEAAAKPPPAIFDNAHPSPLGAVLGRGFFQADHAVCNGVHRLVIQIGGEIVEKENGRVDP